jgi:ectoine hydroxylase-related dioxygenase (phytanoyl-CoA dioxygenase family)
MNADQMRTQICEQGYVCVENFVPYEKLKAFMPEVYKRFERQSFPTWPIPIDADQKHYIRRMAKSYVKRLFRKMKEGY